VIALLVAYAVVTFPYGDVVTAVEHPTPAAVVLVAADVAQSMIPFMPKARIAYAALNIAVVMVKHPSRNPIAEGQLSLARGGRRR
jgi:hypothetical protein